MSIVTVRQAVLVGMALASWGCQPEIQTHQKQFKKQPATSTKLEVKAMSDSTTYPTQHGGPHRNGAIAATVKATPVVGWIRDLGIPSRGRSPQVLVWQAHLVISTAADVQLFRADGEPLWQKRKQDHSPVAVTDQALCFVNRDMYLDAFSLENKQVRRSNHLPGAPNDDF